MPPGVTKKTGEKSNPLSRVPLVRGAETNTGNLQRILDALWTLADADGKIPSKMLGVAVASFWDYFLELRTRKCLSLIYDDVAVQTFVLKERKVPERMDMGNASTVEEKNTPQHCLVLIDAPNLCNKKFVSEAAQLILSDQINFFRARWEHVPHIAAEVTGIPLEHQTCFLYTFVTAAQEREKAYTEELSTLSDTLKTKGVRVVPRRLKDIDSFLIRDMVFETLKQIQKGNDVHIVLFSGDSDYACIVESLRSYTKNMGAHISVTAINWNGGQGKALEKVADKTYAIHQFLPQIDPEGSRMFRLRVKQPALA